MNVTPDNVEGFLWGVVAASVVVFLILIGGNKK